ncbi:MAG: FKBP-type peptidyl-prolyl cis-trans isomerase [Reichenbachiella sp.]
MKRKAIFSIIASALLVYACGQSVKTKSGIEISFLGDRGTEELADSSIILLNMQYVNVNGNDLFNTAEQGSPIPLPVYKQVWDSVGGFYSVLSLCKVNDSVTFKMNADSLFVGTFKMEQVPDSIDAASDITFNIGIVDQMNMEEFQAYRMEQFNKQQEKVAAEAAGMTGAQAEEIQSYLTANSIDADSTESGLRYVVTTKGSGAKPEVGQTVEVHYTGTLMDGTKFDSSVDRNQTFEFPLGQGRVIKGWDEGVALLNIGSKATFFIPSALAYGPRATGTIPANAILKFDVELISVK